MVHHSNPKVVEVVQRELIPATHNEAHNGFEAEIMHHAASRWAHLVARVLDSRSDLRTLDDWARHVAMSVGALKNICRLAHVSARRSLILARLLRALINRRRFGLRIEDLLDVHDRRTVNAWLALAGVAVLDGDVDVFLKTQQIVADTTLVAELARTLTI
jgi:hypothetical protein